MYLGRDGLCLDDPSGMEVRNPCNDAGVSTRIAQDIILIASEVGIDIDLRLSLDQSREWTCSYPCIGQTTKRCCSLTYFVCRTRTNLKFRRYLT